MSLLRRRLRNKLKKLLRRQVHQTWCYASCSDHGVCWKEPRKQEYCECEYGYTGMFCENEIIFYQWWFWFCVFIGTCILLLIPILYFCTRRQRRSMEESEISNSTDSTSIRSLSQSYISAKSTKSLIGKIDHEYI